MLKFLLAHQPTDTGTRSYLHNRDYISEFVYGSIDGSITSFTVVAGATGAGLGLPVIIILGVGSLVADGLSMAVSSFFSKKTERDLAASKAVGEEMGRSTSLAKVPIITGLVTFFSFLVVGSIPLWVYLVTLFFEVTHLDLFLISALATAGGLGLIGALKSVLTKRSLIYGVLETLALGGLAALVAYYIGFFLEQLM